jgi:hypothetical protein
MKHQNRIRVPVKFQIDSKNNIRFSENNTEFTVFASIAMYHTVKPVNVYVDYTCTGHTYVILIAHISNLNVNFLICE